MEWVRFAHVVFGAIWLGGVMYQEALTAGANREGRDPYIRAAIRTQIVNSRIYPVVTILIMATAVWMIVARDELAWGDTWIIISIVIWVAAVANGILYFTPRAKAFEAQLEAEGPSDGLYEQIGKVHQVARVEVIVLLVLAGLMIFQPGA